MALGKSIQTRYGVEAFYWRILSVKEVYDKNQTEVLFVGYKNEDTRRDETFEPMDTILIKIKQTDLTREEIYTVVKNDEALPFYNSFDIL